MIDWYFIACLFSLKVKNVHKFPWTSTFEILSFTHGLFQYVTIAYKTIGFQIATRLYQGFLVCWSKNVNSELTKLNYKDHLRCLKGGYLWHVITRSMWYHQRVFFCLFFLFLLHLRIKKRSLISLRFSSWSVEKSC